MKKSIKKFRFAPIPILLDEDTKDILHRPEVERLGFFSLLEQQYLCGLLYHFLTNGNVLAFSGADVVNFLKKRGYSGFREVPKDELFAMLREANSMIDAKQSSRNSNLFYPSKTSELLNAGRIALARAASIVSSARQENIQRQQMK